MPRAILNQFPSSRKSLYISLHNLGIHKLNRQSPALRWSLQSPIVLGLEQHAELRSVLIMPSLFFRRLGCSARLLTLSVESWVWAAAAAAAAVSLIWISRCLWIARPRSSGSTAAPYTSHVIPSASHSTSFTGVLWHMQSESESEIGSTLKLISGNTWERGEARESDTVCTPTSLSSWSDVMVVASLTVLLKPVWPVLSSRRQEEFCLLNSDPQQCPVLRLSSLVSLTEDTSGGKPSKPEWSSDLCPAQGLPAQGGCDIKCPEHGTTLQVLLKQAVFISVTRTGRSVTCS